MSERILTRARLIIAREAFALKWLKAHGIVSGHSILAAFVKESKVTSWNPDDELSHFQWYAHGFKSPDSERPEFPETEWQTTTVLAKFADVEQVLKDAKKTEDGQELSKLKLEGEQADEFYESDTFRTLFDAANDESPPGTATEKANSALRILSAIFKQGLLGIPPTAAESESAVETAGNESDAQKAENEAALEAAKNKLRAAQFEVAGRSDLPFGRRRWYVVNAKINVDRAKAIINKDEQKDQALAEFGARLLQSRSAKVQTLPKGDPQAKMEAIDLSAANLYEYAKLALDSQFISSNDLSAISEMRKGTVYDYNNALEAYLSVVEGWDKNSTESTGPTGTSGGDDDNDATGGPKLQEFLEALKLTRTALPRDFAPIGPELSREIDAVFQEWKELAPRVFKANGGWDIRNGSPYLQVLGKASAQLDEDIQNLRKRHDKLVGALRQAKFDRQIAEFEKRRVAADAALKEKVDQLPSAARGDLPQLYADGMKEAIVRAEIDDEEIGYRQRLRQHEGFWPSNVALGRDLYWDFVVPYRQAVRRDISRAGNAATLRFDLDVTTFSLLVKAWEILKDVKGPGQPDVLNFKFKSGGTPHPKAPEFAQLRSRHWEALKEFTNVADVEMRARWAREAAEKMRRQAEEEEERKRKRTAAPKTPIVSKATTPTTRTISARKVETQRTTVPSAAPAPLPSTTPATSTPSRRFDFFTLIEPSTRELTEPPKPKEAPATQAFDPNNFWYYGPVGTNGFSKADDEKHFRYSRGLEKVPATNPWIPQARGEDLR